jgi:phage terminase large subunit-like protein
MKKYANILYELNGGESAIQIFIRKNLNIFNQQENPMACITYFPSQRHTNPDPLP